MNVRLRILFLILVALIVRGSNAFAIDSTQHAPTPQQWERLTADKAFEYKTEKEGVRPKEEPDSNAITKLIYLLAAFFNTVLGTGILWLLLFAFAAWALYKIFLGNVFQRGKKYKRPPPGEYENMEDLAATNWEAALQKAIDQKELRLAIRYSYMLLLQLMQEKGQIQYRPDKTNYEYYHELSERYQSDFRLLTRQYEYAWYGNFDVAEKSYSKYMETFNHLKSII
jgi:hypothetical protein